MATAEVTYHLAYELLKFLFINHDTPPQSHRNNNW